MNYSRNNNIINIKAFEKKLLSTNSIVLLITIIIVTILFVFIIIRSQIAHKQIERNDITYAINSYQSNLSEKISIIASKYIFRDFLNSGAETRKIIESKFLRETLPILKNGVIGFTLLNTFSNNTYTIGTKSISYLELNICYIGEYLDSENGNCYAILKLYFSIPTVMSELKKINYKIIESTNTNEFKLGFDNNFGSLKVRFSNIKLPIIEKELPNYFIYYYFLTVFLLGLFAIISKYRFKNLLSNIIYIPLSQLLNQIEKATCIEENSNALYEINYLIKKIKHYQEFMENNKKNEKSIALGELAAHVAHDIKSPLIVMQIVYDKIKDTLNPTLNELLGKSIANIDNITHNLLLNYRHATEKQTLSLTNQSKTYINHHQSFYSPLLIILKNFVSYKMNEWENKNVKLTLEIPKNFDVISIWSNLSPQIFERILSNLLNNAFEACICESEIDISFEISGDFIIIHIKDNGIGIPEDRILPAMNGSSSKHFGNGFGLSTAKKFLEEINGQIHIKSKVSIGTTISLQIPVVALPHWLITDLNLIKENLVYFINISEDTVNLFASIGINPFKIFTNFDEFLNYYSNTQINNNTKIFLEFENKINGEFLIKISNLKLNTFVIVNDFSTDYLNPLLQYQFPLIFKKTIPFLYLKHRSTQFINTK